MRPGRSNIYIAGFAALLVIGLAVGYFFYKSNNENPVSGLKPRVELGVGKINAITDSTVDVTLSLLVDNPLPVGIAIQGFEYQVQMDGTTILDSRYSDPLQIEPGDSSVLELPVQLKIKKLKAINDRAGEQQDSANYRFKGTFGLKESVLGLDTLRLTVEKRLVRYRLPSVEVVGYELDKFGLSQSKVEIQLRFSNKNFFPISFKDPTYALDLGSQKQMARGQVQSLTRVEGRSSNTYTIPLSIDMGDLLKATGQLIAQGENLPFTLHFSCTLTADNEMFNNSEVKLVVEGTMEDLKTAQENLGD